MYLAHSLINGDFFLNDYIRLNFDGRLICNSVYLGGFFCLLGTVRGEICGSNKSRFEAMVGPIH
jgi:hypothetical protein